MAIPLSRSLFTMAMLLLGMMSLPSCLASAQPVGIFEGHGDVGTVLHPGSTIFDSTRQTYTLSGSGNNMWKGEDDFQFAWKKMSGDVVISANVNFEGSGGNPHRKAVLMIRQSLDSGSAAVDIAVHGVGMLALQYRDAPDADMHEIQAKDSAPAIVRIEKRGDFFYAFMSGKDGLLRPMGAATKVPIQGEFYAGIGVCAHDKNVVEKAVFTNVKVEQIPSLGGKHTLFSTLETIVIPATDRQVEYVAAANFEAPNWSRDGSSLVFNQDHTIRRLVIGAEEPNLIDIAPLNHVNDDHGISPDGKWLAVSDRSAPDGKSRVFVLPVAGGKPREVTGEGPSYFHGWSPDGETLVFSGERGGNFDVFTIPAKGGDERRLTTATGIDDGPEYSPDGASIYFHSDRSGRMQIWRMKPDGTAQEQVIKDDRNDWFPHPSPNGQWLVYLSYKGDVTGHPAEQDVELRLISLKDGQVRVLAKLFGGNGTINSPSWSPDSSKLAFVSYEEIPEESLSRK